MTTTTPLNSGSQSTAATTTSRTATTETIDVGGTPFAYRALGPGGGIEKMPLIAGSAYTKAALTLRDPRHFLFFNRNAPGKRAASEYMARLKKRTEDRDKRISLQARIAQLKAIREAGLGKPHDLG